MNPSDPLDRLFAAARREPAPIVDVTQSVAARLAELSLERNRETIWWVTGIVSLVTAASLMLSVYPLIEAWSDPLFGWFEPVRIALR